MECDAGPSFPALPLIQDDGLLRREIPPRPAKTGLVGGPGFARRGFHGARRVCHGANPITDPTDEADYTDVNGTGLTGSDLHGEKINGAKAEMHRCSTRP